MRKRRNGFHHGFDSIVESLILHGYHPFPCCRCFSKTPPKPTSSLPHNPASSNRPLATHCDRSGPRGNQWAERQIWWPTRWSQRKAPPKRARGGGWAGWLSGYWSRTWCRASPRRPCMWQKLELARRPRISTRRSFAFCFNFLSFDIFLELVREEENGWAEKKRELCLGIGNIWVRSQVWSHKKVEIFEWCELKKCAKRMGIGNWGILSDEWRKLSEEWWVIVFKTPNSPL